MKSFLSATVFHPPPHLSGVGGKDMRICPMINIKEMAKINVHTPERVRERWGYDKEYETLANNNFEVIKLSVRNANGNEVGVAHNC